MKKVITISSIDAIAGRMLLAAHGLEDNTSISVFLDDEPAAWGKAKVAGEMALVIGNRPLPSTYSLRLAVYPVKAKLLPAAE